MPPSRLRATPKNAARCAFGPRTEAPAPRPGAACNARPRSTPPAESARRAAAKEAKVAWIATPQPGPAGPHRVGNGALFVMNATTAFVNAASNTLQIRGACFPVGALGRQAQYLCCRGRRDPCLEWLPGQLLGRGRQAPAPSQAENDGKAARSAAHSAAVFGPDLISDRVGISGPTGDLGTAMAWLSPMALLQSSPPFGD